MDLSVKDKIINFLEENMGEKSSKPCVKQDFLGHRKHKT